MFCANIRVSTVQQETQTLLRYAEFEFINPVQHEFRREYCARQTDDKSVRRWYEQFGETGSVGKEIILRSLEDMMKM